MMDMENLLEAQRRFVTANRASPSRARRAPESSHAVTRSPKRSTKKSPLHVGMDDVSKDLESSASMEGVTKDASALVTLTQVHCEYMETLGEEGINSRQRGQEPSLDDLLRHYLHMKRDLASRINVTEATAEKVNETEKKRLLHDAVLQSKDEPWK